MVKVLKAFLVSDDCFAASLLLAGGLLAVLVQLAASSGLGQQ